MHCICWHLHQVPEEAPQWSSSALKRQKLQQQPPAKAAAHVGHSAKPRALSTAQSLYDGQVLVRIPLLPCVPGLGQQPAYLSSWLTTFRSTQSLPLRQCPAACIKHERGVLVHPVAPRRPKACASEEAQAHTYNLSHTAVMTKARH